MKCIIHAVMLSMSAALAVACSLPNSEPTAGSESHFLTACDDTCGSGLSCRCGACTSGCVTSSDCLKFHPDAECVAAPDVDAGPSCEQGQTSAHCDVPCVNALDCGAFGSNYFCSRGYCRQDPLSQSNEPLPGYGVLCSQSVASCSLVPSAPSLVGNYTGDATVVLSSNALWAVNNVHSFTASVTAQSGGTLSGTASLPSFVIDLTDGIVRGQGSTFSIYHSTFVNQDGCDLEVRAVLSGTLDANASPITITGGLAMRFTGNYSGAACTPEQIDVYPATGANFSITATQ